MGGRAGGLSRFPPAARLHFLTLVAHHPHLQIIMSFLADPQTAATVLSIILLLSEHDEAEAYLGDADPWVTVSGRVLQRVVPLVLCNVSRAHTQTSCTRTGPSGGEAVCQIP